MSHQVCWWSFRAIQARNTNKSGERTGGKIKMPKISIGQNGFMALFTDCEGNNMALHFE
jgi:predicted enzyme related to lactoylglutathione lyase